MPYYPRKNLSTPRTLPIYKISYPDRRSPSGTSTVLLRHKADVERWEKRYGVKAEEITVSNMEFQMLIKKRLL